jgi:hypothetical protein
VKANPIDCERPTIKSCYESILAWHPIQNDSAPVLRTLEHFLEVMAFEATSHVHERQLDFLGVGQLANPQNQLSFF